jgi:hypothetical protein
MQMPKSAPSFAAESSLQKDLLKEHLRQYETYGQCGIKNLTRGKIRYYGELAGSKKPGPMVGRRLVREWNYCKNEYRTWHETLDKTGRVRIVRPENNNALKRHFIFKEDGSYGGIR